MERDGDLEEEEEEEEESGEGDQYEWHQIRGTPELLSLISNQRGVGLP